MYVPVSRGDWKNNKLSLAFTGNRVEIVGDVKQKISVRIDGKKPSEIKEAFIRSSENTGISTAIGIIHYKASPPEQTFTVTIKSFSDAKNFTYTVEGSETGFEGISGERGVLDGKYLYMTDESFIFHPAVDKPVPGQQYTFKSILNGTDFYEGENPLISGIPVGEHTLELEAYGEIPDIKAVKIFNPNNLLK